MKQYIVSWTVTVNADTAEEAEKRAQDILNGGDTTLDVEEIEDGMEVAL